MKYSFVLSIILIGSISLYGTYRWLSTSKTYHTPDYRLLKSLLKAKNWQAADTETTWLMQTIALDATPPENALGHRWFKLSGTVVLEDFPCQELSRIDQLWRDASGDRFGFTPQSRIWSRVNPDHKPYNFDAYKAFEKQVGWGTPTNPDEASRGYFPSNGWMESLAQTGEPWMEVGNSVYQKLASCEPL